MQLKLNPWRKLFPLQVTRRIYLWVLLLTLVPMAIVAILVPIMAYKEEKAARQEELYAVAYALDQRVQGSFVEILQKQGALDRPVDDRVLALNAALQPIINEISLSHPGLSLGYYSIELDRVLAFGPRFDPARLVRVPRSYPYFKSYETGRPEVAYDSVGWWGKPVLNLTYPIHRDGKIIGHTWAAVKMEDIYLSALLQSATILLAGLALAVVGIFLAWFFTRQLRRDLERFAGAAVRGGPNVLDGLFPELNPLLEVVHQHQLEVRMATAGQLATSVVHEIRNPFTSIRGFSQLLLLGETDQQKRARLEIIVREVDRVNQLITDFLRFAKPSEPVLEDTPVTMVLSELESLIGGHCLEAGVQLKVSAGEPYLCCLCDPNQLKQVLLNLSQNALQALEGQKDGVISVQARRDRGLVIIEVSDSTFALEKCPETLAVSEI